MKEAPPPPHDDAEDLRRLGYAQELSRGMGAFSSFALSFSIISILTGAVVLYGHGLKYGGPLVMTVGWPLVTVMTLTVAASLAELASAYPTAGALYHWAALLGGRRAGFFTAWLNTIGQFAITAGIDYGLAEFLAPMVGWKTDRPHVLALCAVILLSHAVLNHVGVKVVARLNTVSAWVHVLGVALFVGALLALAPRREPSFLLARTTVAKTYGLGFALGLLQAQWTFTGYDASAHVTEETVDPRRNAPRGILMSVIVSGVAGWILLLALTAAIKGDPAVVAATDNPFVTVVRDALGARLGDRLVWVAMAAMWFCGLASVTSNSRMLYAFARDGGTPFAKELARVSPRWSSPHVAVWVSVVAAAGVAAFAQALAAMTALSTLALYASYVLPIVYAVIARADGRLQRGPFTLGRWSRAVNLVAIAWVAVVTVLFVIPPNQLAGYAFAASLVLIGLGWSLWAKARFPGPKVVE